MVEEQIGEVEKLSVVMQLRLVAFTLDDLQAFFRFLLTHGVLITNPAHDLKFLNIWSHVSSKSFFKVS